MALGVENYRIIYTANGTDDTFAITDEFFDDSENIRVYIRNESVNPITETLQVEGVDYNVVGTDVVFVSPPASGRKVGIFREMPLEQTLDMIASGAFNVESLEKQLDRMVAISQQLAGGLARALKVKKTSQNLDLEVPEPSANKFLKWNAGATALENDDGSSVGAGTKVVGEVPSGSVDNTNQDFILANAPLAGTLAVYKNGRRVTDYSLAGATITMDDPLGFGAEIVCDYEV